MSVKIWHNPRCTKSRQTLALIENNGQSPEVFSYLKDAPDKEELAAVLRLLDIPVIDMIRTGEKAFKELGLSKTDSEHTLIAAMASHPVLIERPIVIANGKAVIGRPPERVLEII